MNVYLLLFLYLIPFLPFLVAKVIKLFYRVKIRLSDNVENAIQYRSKIENLRYSIINITKKTTLVFLIAIVILYIAVCFISIIQGDFEWQGFLMVTYYLCCFIALRRWYVNRLESINHPISTITAKDFLEKDEDFVLFLRGFKEDRYNLREPGKNDFNELLFSKTVNDRLHLPMYAIGMSKEVDSPYGATRIYVDDDNWQRDILTMIYRAKKIFVLVSGSKSCIWEIEQLTAHLDKVIFIVNRIEGYNEAIKKSPVTLAVNFPAGFKGKHFFFKYEGTPVPYSNTTIDYAKIAMDESDYLDLVTRIKEEEDCMLKERKKKQIIFEKHLTPAALILMVIFLFAIIYYGIVH